LETIKTTCEAKKLRSFSVSKPEIFERKDIEESILRTKYDSSVFPEFI